MSFSAKRTLFWKDLYTINTSRGTDFGGLMVGLTSWVSLIHYKKQRWDNFNKSQLAFFLIGVQELPCSPSLEPSISSMPFFWFPPERLQAKSLFANHPITQKYHSSSKNHPQNSSPSLLYCNDLVSMEVSYLEENAEKTAVSPSSEINDPFCVCDPFLVWRVGWKRDQIVTLSDRDQGDQAGALCLNHRGGAFCWDFDEFCSKTHLWGSPSLQLKCVQILAFSFRFFYQPFWIR